MTAHRNTQVVSGIFVIYVVLSLEWCFEWLKSPKLRILSQSISFEEPWRRVTHRRFEMSAKN